MKLSSTFCVVAISILIAAIPLGAQDMNSRDLREILHEEAEEISGKNGVWEFSYEGMRMLLLTDESFNRMRVIAPIDLITNISQGEIMNALTANFHTALDVKYAVSDDLMWSVFIHPLKELSPDQFRDALAQVRQAVVTFGSTYSSTDLVFPGGSEGSDEAPGKINKM